MGGPLSVTLSDVYMSKMEDRIVGKHQPKVYKHYVDDTINRHKNSYICCSMN